MNVAEGTAHTLTTDQPKFMWQEGWWLQHQRLLTALSEQKRRPGIVLSGDLHAIGHSRLMRSDDLDLKGNPVHAIITGTPGCNAGWASRMRGTAPVAATGVVHEVQGEVLEKNGFTLVDFTETEVRVCLFAWTKDQPKEAIDTLQPYHSAVMQRG